MEMRMQGQPCAPEPSQAVAHLFITLWWEVHRGLPRNQNRVIGA